LKERDCGGRSDRYSSRSRQSTGRSESFGRAVIRRSTYRAWSRPSLQCAAVGGLASLGSAPGVDNRLSANHCGRAFSSRRRRASRARPMIGMSSPSKARPSGNIHSPRTGNMLKNPPQTKRTPTGTRAHLEVGRRSQRTKVCRRSGRRLISRSTRCSSVCAAIASCISSSFNEVFSAEPVAAGHARPKMPRRSLRTFAARGRGRLQRKTSSIAIAWHDNSTRLANCEPVEIGDESDGPAALNPNGCFARGQRSDIARLPSFGVLARGARIRWF
jgi:hypothetical protein